MTTHSPLTQTAAIEAEADQGQADDQRRDQHVIRLGEPRGEADRPEYDGEQRRRAADRGDQAAHDAGSDEGAIAHGRIRSWARKGSRHWWWRPSAPSRRS